MKIVFGVVGAEGLGNISTDEEVWRLGNEMLDQDTVRQMAGSHRTLLMSEGLMECCSVEMQEEATTTFDLDHSDHI